MFSLNSSCCISVHTFYVSRSQSPFCWRVEVITFYHFQHCTAQPVSSTPRQSSCANWSIWIKEKWEKASNSGPRMSTLNCSFILFCANYGFAEINSRQCSNLCGDCLDSWFEEVNYHSNTPSLPSLDLGMARSKMITTYISHIAIESIVQWWNDYTNILDQEFFFRGRPGQTVTKSRRIKMASFVLCTQCNVYFWF